MLRIYVFILGLMNIIVIVAIMSILVLGVNSGSNTTTVVSWWGFIPIINLLLVPLVFNSIPMFFAWKLSTDTLFKVTFMSILFVLNVLQILFFGYFLYGTIIDYIQ